MLGAALVLAAGLLIAFMMRSGTPYEASGSEQIATVSTITASDAGAMMEDGAPFILLDVRTEEEFLSEHIPGAIWLPQAEFPARLADVLPDRAVRVLLYCRSGNRSAEAAEALIALGYMNVYDFGGIIDWPYDIVSG